MATQEKLKRYGKCLIEKEIGRGARSTVYLAWHEGLQIPVAVKVMKKEGGGDDDLFSERFTREARIAAQLTHAHIVRVYDCGESDDSFYLVLEYIEGESCRDRMEDGDGFDWRSACRIIRDVADSLNYASTKGIIHRDLKPENIMIDKEGRARLADLGLAKEVSPGRASATADGDVLGTPYYMSPEQVRQPGDVDFRADIYSLGATLYHMTTGQVPFEAPTPFEIMTMHLNEPLTPPQVRDPELPEPLCDIIMRAMAKEPQSRYQSYGDLIRDLDALTSAEKEPPVDALMAAVEDTLDEEPPTPQRPLRAMPEDAPETVAAEIEPEPRQRRMMPAELPTTVFDVRCKALGLGAVLMYAFSAVWLHYVVATLLGPIAGAAAMGIVVAASVAAGWRAIHPGTESDDTHPFDQQFSTSLGWLCERLDLPTPRIQMERRQDEQCRAFAFFSSRATLYVPAGWLELARLDDARMHAFLAQKAADIYNGNATIRTLLALPIGLVALGERVSTWVINPRRLSARARLRASRAAAMAGLAATCTVIAVLLFLGLKVGPVMLWIGVLALASFCTLLLVGAFERQSRICGDLLAVRAVGERDVVRSLAVVSGLLSLERDLLLRESLGPEADSVRTDGLPAPDERARIVEAIASHYSAVAHSPDALEMARKALSAQPSVGERLNRLAGLPRPRSALLKLIGLGRRSYARILGDGTKRPTALADLADMSPFAAPAVMAGVLSVAAMAFLLWNRGNRYEDYLLVVGSLSAAVGFIGAREACKRQPTAGQLGWAAVVSSMCITVVTMAGFAIVGHQRLALQFPITLSISGGLAVLAGIVVVRLRDRSTRVSPVPTGEPNLGARTAHTMMVAGDGQKRPEGDADDGPADDSD